MPITPLHFGVLAPLNRMAPGKVNNAAFMLVNVLIDAKSILYGLTGYGDIDHAGVHSFVGVLFPIFIIGVLWPHRRAWWLGAALGGISHIALDMLVHADMGPLVPFMESNPFYIGAMVPLSAALLVLCVWLTAQYVSGILGWAQKRTEEIRRVIVKQEP